MGQIIKAGNGNHCQHRTDDGGKGKAKQANPCLSTRLKAKIRRKDQITRAKEHGEQRDTDQNDTAFV